MSIDNDTQDRIVLAALDLFMRQGIRKTSLEEIAQQAGVTRVTVYRYFGDKQDLVQAAFLRSESPFQQACLDLQQHAERDPKDILDQIGHEMSSLPSGDLATRLDELKHVYPGVYTTYQKIRLETMECIFDHLFSTAERDGLLRPGITRQVAQAVYWLLVMNAFESPAMRNLGLSGTGMFNVISDIFLYGIFKDRRDK